MKKGVMKYCPTFVSQSILDINYDQLKENGKEIIIFDLDNTIISYFETTPSKPLVELSKKVLNMGFQTYILTNNGSKRLDKCLETFKCTGSRTYMRKPFTSRISAFFKENNFDLNKIIMIGDQLVTDISCASKLGVDSILIKSINRDSEHLYTRINRLREKPIVNKIIKINPEYGNKIKKIIEREKK